VGMSDTKSETKNEDKDNKDTPSELEQKIIKQIEFYFSDSNFSNR